jgi:hypothetical protein
MIDRKGKRKRKARYFALLVSIKTSSLEWVTVNGWNHKGADKAARYYSQAVNFKHTYADRFTLKKIILIG